MFRLIASAVLLVCLSISAFYRYRARKQGGTIPRRSENTFLVVTRIFGTLPLAAAIVAHIVIPGWMDWASFPAPDWVRWLGVMLGLLTLPAVYWVFSSLESNVSETVLTKQTHQLVTKGPYRWVRHPLYSTGLSLLVSIGLMTASWLILAFTAGAFLLFRFLIVPMEEQQLLLKFGDDYRAMMNRTGRFLPGM